MNRELNRSLGQIIEMIYLDREGNLTQRRIKPLSIQGDILKAYCLMRKEVRSFSIDNILAVLPVRKVFSSSTPPSISIHASSLKL